MLCLRTYCSSFHQDCVQAAVNHAPQQRRLHTRNPTSSCIDQVLGSLDLQNFHSVGKTSNGMSIAFGRNAA